LVKKEDVLDELERMSRERFQRLCLYLLEKMGFQITSARSSNGDLEAEGEIHREDRIDDYVIRITRSGGDPSKEIEGMKDVLGPGVMGFYLTTKETEDVKGVKNIEIADGERFYELLKEYDKIPKINEETESRTLSSATEQDRLLRWGDEFREKGDIKKALEYYRKAVQRKPEDITARRKTAETLLEDGQVMDAIELIEDSIEALSESPNLWNILGRAYHKIERYDDEVEAYESALDINEDHVPSWKNLGAVLFEREEYDEAALCFDRVLEVEPKDEVAWNNKGLCLIIKGDLKEALNCIDNALSIYPEFEDALINKILIFEKQNRVSKAIQLADKLTQLYPKKENYQYIKGAFLEKAGYKEDALDSLNKALKLNPNYDAAIKLKQSIEVSIEQVPTEEKTTETVPEEEERKVDHIQEVIEEKDKLQVKLEETKRELKRIKETKKEIEKELADLRQQEVPESDEEQEIMNTLKEKENRLEQVIKEKKEVQKTLKDTRKELDEVRMEKSELEEKIDQIKIKGEDGGVDVDKRLEDQRDQIQRLQQEKDKLKENLDRRRNFIQKLRDSKKELEEELERIKEKAIEEDIKDELRKREERIVDLEKERDELNEKLEELEEEKKGEEVIMEGMAHVRKEEERLKEKITYGETEIIWKIGDYDKIIEKLSGNESQDFLNLLGASYYRKGDIDTAEEVFRKGNKSLLAKLNLEELYYQNGQYHNSIKISEEIVQEKESNCVYWERRGECLRRAGKVGDAVLAYLKAEEFSEEELIDFIMAEARCNAGSEDLEKGIETLNKIPETYKVEDIFNLLGVFKYKNNEYKESIKDFRRAVNKEEHVFYNNLGCSAYKLGRFGEALSSLENSVEIYPENPIYLNNLGYCQLQRNLIDSAYDNLRRALEIDKDDPVTLYNLGLAEREKGIDEWKKKIQKAFEISSEFEEAKKILEE